MKGTEQVVECYVPPSAFVKGSSCARLHERRDMTGVGVATWDWVKKDYSGTSLIRTAWDQHPFRLVKFSD